MPIRSRVLLLLVALSVGALHPAASAQLLTTSTTSTTTTTTVAETTTSSTEPTTSTSSSTTSSTTTTTVPAGSGLSISVPATAAAAATVSTGAGSVSIGLGQVQVTDTRTISLLNPSRGWEASVSLGQPFAALAPASFAIPAADVAYLSGLGTGIGLGLGTLTPGQDGVTQGAQTLDTTRRAMLASGLSLSGSVVTWSPTITVTIPPGAPAGDYQGTITHSVS